MMAVEASRPSRKSANCTEAKKARREFFGADMGFGSGLDGIRLGLLQCSPGQADAVRGLQGEALHVDDMRELQEAAGAAGGHQGRAMCCRGCQGRCLAACNFSAQSGLGEGKGAAQTAAERRAGLVGKIHIGQSPQKRARRLGDAMAP